MSDYDRGPYTPGSEPPLAFEDRRARRGGGPPPVTLILSLLLLLAVGGGVYFIYRGGARTAGEPPQPVGAPVRDVKIAAPPQAPASDPAAGLSIYKDNQDTNLAAPAFVPPPEQPTPRPVPPVTATPAPAAVQPIPPATQVAAAATPAIAPPTKTAAKPADKAPTIDKILADNADVKSPAKPLVKPAVKTPSAIAEKPVSAPAKTAATTAESTTGPAAMVQIGAYSSKGLADTAWDTAAGAAPGVMAGKGKHVVPFTRADGTVLYRTAITGFATRADAVKLCAKLQAAGQSCIVK